MARSVHEHTAAPGRAGRVRPSTTDVLAVLKEQFGELYEQSYERGKREFVDAIKRRYDLSEDDAVAVIDGLEHTEALRFHPEAMGRNPEVPRVGLFDEPNPTPAAETPSDVVGRHWKIGRDDVTVDRL